MTLMQMPNLVSIELSNIIFSFFTFSQYSKKLLEENSEIIKINPSINLYFTISFS